jgi:hypothetical protein
MAVRSYAIRPRLTQPVPICAVWVAALLRQARGVLGRQTPFFHVKGTGLKPALTFRGSLAGGGSRD